MSDAIELGPNRYGKSAIRLVKVDRSGGDRHALRDLTVDVALEGDFEAAHVAGDNALVIATDTMKNTVYAFAREGLLADTPLESFGAQLARHFASHAQVARAHVTLREHAWQRMPTTAGGAPDAFVREGSGTRVAVVVAAGDAIEVEAGVEDLVVMKTTRSAFAGFPRDRYTTLKDTDDRIMATKVTAAWRYGPGASGDDLDFDAAFDAIRATFLAELAEHHSPSVQASIWIVARAMLAAHPEIDEIRMRLPNLHHWLVDLAPFGLDNPGEVFVATTEPHGLIEATVRRSS